MENVVSEEKPPFLDGKFPTVESFCQSALKTIALATKASNNGIPSDSTETWNYYSTFRDFRRVMNAESEKLSNLIRSCLRFNGIKPEISDALLNTEAEKLIEILTDANDHILERISSNLDEAQGLKKNASSTEVSLLEVSKSRVSRVATSSSPATMESWNQRTVQNSKVKLLAAKNVTRPQLKFKHLIDNSPNTPFIPRLTTKPNSLKPLSILVEYNSETGTEFYSHPYLFEIERFSPTEEMMKMTSSPTESLISINDATLDIIDSLDKLREMIKVLKGESEIGVDLEAHSYRSFMGITCLIQISTRSRDFIVDPFPIWGDLTELNEVFTDPKIVKILHGAEGDIKWLQRDFSIYIVNMFDTYQAAKLLEFGRGCLSLKYLLFKYVNVSTDKQYQLADWRIRPLPKEMIQYARSDTRYLIDIYRLMKRDLIEKGNQHGNLLQSAYDHSNIICKMRFEKPVFDEYKYMEMLKNSRQHFNAQQLCALKSLYEWRHKTGREDDESEFYVLPNHMLLNISYELPREMQGILALCNPVPPHVKQHLSTLHRIILNAREQTVAPTITNVIAVESEPLFSNLDFAEDPLKCPLDFSKVGKDSELGTVINNTLPDIKLMSGKRKTTPDISIFGESKAIISKGKASSIKILLSPFERYELLIPYLKSLKKEKDELEVKEEEKKEVKKNDVEGRINSIKQHFDALTKLTPEEYSEPITKEEKGIEEESKDKGVVSSESDNKVAEEAMEEEIKIGNNRKRKRRKSFIEKSQNPPPEKQKPAVNYETFDISQFSKGPKENPNEYNPMKKFREKYSKKQHKNKKPFNKGQGRSHTYKK